MWAFITVCFYTLNVQNVNKMSSTGTLFEGEKMRAYTQPKHQPCFKNKNQLPFGRPFVHCLRWSVVTTIFDPSPDIQSTLALQDWFTIVIGDNKTPTNFLHQINFTKHRNVIFLSADDQKRIASNPDTAPEVAKFIAAVPFNHFGRKNIGYLFALAHGAKFIYDFIEFINISII